MALDQAIEWQLDLFRLDADTRRRILPILDKLEKELVALVPNTDASKRRRDALLKEAREAIAKYYREAQAELFATTNGLAPIAARATTVAVSIDAQLPTAGVLSSIAGDAIIQGATMAQWWAKQEADTAFRFAAAVRQGIAAGETNAQIIQRVRGTAGFPGVMEISRKNAAALVQTSVQQVANDARMATFRANEDLIEAYVWVATLDHSTCLVCAPRDGLAWKTSGAPIEHNIKWMEPPAHFNCLTGDSKVSACDDITGTSKRWFNGEVIVIRTASGKELTCTPNHPILTRGGWVGAGAIDIGSNVVCDGGIERRGFADCDDKNMPSTIEDKIESFLSSRSVSAVPMPVSAPDFHGDGIGSEIAIVFSESLLRDSNNPALVEHRFQNALGLGHSDRESFFFGLGGSNKPFHWSFLTAKRIMVALQKFCSFAWGKLCPSSVLLLASIPCFYPSISKRTGENHASGSKLLGNAGYTPPGVEQLQSCININGGESSLCVNSSSLETAESNSFTDSNLASSLCNGEAGPVFFDQVVNIERRNFSGHVFNLETVKGWYVANGIITHNCRCVIVPDTGRGVGGTRASMDGPTTGTFADFLERKGEDFQNEVLGPGRAQLWRDGKITLQDLVNGRGNPLTLAELRKRHG